MPFLIKMPKLSPTMETGEIVQWHKKEGEKISEGDLLFDVATDKARIEYHSPEEGYLRKILVTEGQSAALNAPVAILTVAANENVEGFLLSIAPQPASKKEEEKKKEEKKPQEFLEQVSLPSPAFLPFPPLEKITFPKERGEFQQRILASPLARRLAKEEKLDLTSIQGSGPDGRIMSRDLVYARKKSFLSLGEKDLPEFPSGTYEEEKISPMKRTVGKRLQEAQMFIPHFYIKQEINVSLLVEMRNELKDTGIELTFNDFVIKAAAFALRENPHVNSGFHGQNKTLIRFKTVDIAVAVSLSEGLITPIIRYADFKAIGQISLEMKQLTLRAKEGKLAPHEYMGGSFTISNLGMYGISEFSAIINPPQAAILAVGAIEERAFIKESKIVVGKGMNMTFSFDHRVVDGAEGALFVKSLKTFLEHPAMLLL